MHGVLEARNVTVGYGQSPVLASLSLKIRQGEVTALVGPNGSGKSTLLKTLARLLRPQSGTVMLDGQPIDRLSTTAVARRLAILPQTHTAPMGTTVRELVEQGRYPHSGPLRMLRRQDHEAIDFALEATGMTSLAGRLLSQLSGGERQRAWIALTLAQSTPILLLDEPTTFLDIGHQLEILELVAGFNRSCGMTLVLVLHDLNHAARYTNRMVVLNGGAIVADGTPADVLTPGMLADVFRVQADIVTDVRASHPICIPYASV
jgi:iron complex transport system ATP-binding protein